MFKELVVPYPQPLTQKDISILEVINANFRADDFKIEHSDDKIIILLREIDFEKLKTLVGKYSRSMDTPILSDIVEKIGEIKSYGIKGKKRNYVDYNKERKVRNRIEKERKRGQFHYTKGNKFSKENTELPQKYIDKIICGDSEFLLKDFPDNCIDLIFTSPPYNFGLDYNKNEDDHDWEKYFDKLFKVFDECVRILKYSGRIIVNIQPLFSDYIPSHHIISNYFLNKKLIWKGEILWEKNNYNCKYTAWGSWKSPSSPYLKYTWEFLEIFAKGKLKKAGKVEDIDITADEFKKWVVAKWSIAPEREMKKYNHPAMFPENLVERVLKLFSFQNDIVLDPFNGVGTTTAVAKRLNRRYVGIDISDEYCESAERRLLEVIDEMGLFAYASRED